MEFTTLEIVEWGTFLATLFVFFSGMPSCIHMLLTRDTRHYPFLFFIVGLINCLSVALYGLMVESSGVLYMNLTGVFFNAIYTLSYLLVTKEKMAALYHIFAAATYCSLLYYYLKSINDPSEAVNTLGILNTIVTMTLVTLPLLQVKDFYHCKSCEGMSLTMWIGGTLCSMMWFIYGQLLEDPYIYLPNIPGFITSAILFAALMKYGRAESKYREKSD